MKEIFVFGAGKYGKALLHYLENHGIRIAGFVQTEAAPDKLCEGLPVYSLRRSRSRLSDAYVFLAVADNNVRKQIRSVLVSYGTDEQNIFDAARYIEDNCFAAGEKFCLLCGNQVAEFLPGGSQAAIFQKAHIIGGGNRPNAICPVCGGLDRARWCWYVIEHFTKIMEKQCSVLHFAPEPGISSLIQTNRKCRYISADIEPKRGMLEIDVTDIPFKDAYFDYIIINHVLEHILDESAAVSELKRVLKDNGTLITSFPIRTDMDTFDDDSIFTKEDRLLYFGQEDHVRLYGRDYKERLERYGLVVDTYSPEQILDDAAIAKFCLIRDDIVMLVKKQYIKRSSL